MSIELEPFMAELAERNPGEPEFHQAVREVALHVIPVIRENRAYREAKVLERMTEPDRVIMFRVCWVDDAGEVQVNRGYRVQFNGAIGPYKGGLRFDRSVNLSVLKFLGFEQVFKNSLTTLPLGGAKGGADFDPRGRSDAEVMRFCQAYMSELFRHIGKDVDVPAGDINVGTREIGYLFGQYRRLQNEWTGAMTGKGVSYGGSWVRTEATGFGCVYFAREMMRHASKKFAGRRCVISGAGNVSQYTAKKLIELGAKVVSLSDRTGYVHFPDGLDAQGLEEVIELKTGRRGSLDELANGNGWEFVAGAAPWEVPCDMAFPSATQNELDDAGARSLIDNGCKLLCEGANMPATEEAARRLGEAAILYAPSKAANAGGVAISGLEMTQNAIRLSWTREEVDKRLQEIMGQIHAKCVDHGTVNGRVDYVQGANVAGFRKVADAMVAFGVM